MADAVFADRLNSQTRVGHTRTVRNEMGALVPAGPADCLERLVPCGRCGMVMKVQFPRNEVAVLLQGGQVMGLQRDGSGWHGVIACLQENCTRNGNTSQVPYHLPENDVRRLAAGIGLNGYGAPVQAQARPQAQPATQQSQQTQAALQMAQQAALRAQQAEQRSAALQQQMAQLIVMMQGRR